MALVDYSSDSSSDDDAGPPPAKRRKSTGADSAPSTDAASVSAMPPLPSAFHDLYASTVRQSVVDDPSLHQGRKRVTPHVVGNWPTHLYVEWYPTAEQHALLVQLVAGVEAKLGDDVKLHNFLTSDLGSPLPLHISLSRPITFTAAEKDEFLEKIEKTIQSSQVAAFHVCPQDLAWYKSPDSDRTFLILRVASDESNNRSASLNPELTSLLSRCNTVVTSFNQPALYQRDQTASVGSAFHVSIGWTFDETSEKASAETVGLFHQRNFSRIRSWKIEVPGIKVKIGNVVSHVPLGGSGKASISTNSGLFG